MIASPRLRSRIDADPRVTIRSKIVVTEGFLILVDPETSRQFDLQFFLRGDYATLKQRRIDRQGYVRYPPSPDVFRCP